ncbi:glycosyltransferase family 4 protein [Candidatus Woesearchaeota archaeon]|nr:glycosyltransferase family 4 protein [Candidatus Pacearchaeota archaeon]MBS3119147.1 glycosyltransferase family 4 protein [Candidatus Woesearchaeota archaeon]
MRKPNLVIATDTWYPRKDGIVRFLNELLPSLVKDFNVIVLAPNYDSSHVLHKKHKFLLVKLPLSWYGVAGHRSIKLNAENRAAIEEQVKNADVVWAQGQAAIGRYALRYSKKHHKPALVYIHQMDWELLPRAMGVPGILRWFISPWLRRMTIEKTNQFNLTMFPHFGLAEIFEERGFQGRWEIVQLGVNFHHFRPAKDKQQAKEAIGYSHKEKIICYLGRISTEKNLDTLSKAYIKLRDKLTNARLLIIGGGSERKVAELQQINGVKVTGFVSDVVPYLQAADVFVMPSLTETTSLATLEAMACGLPVIVTKVGFMKEYIKKDYNGMFFPRNNVTNLSLKIMHLLMDKRKRAELGENARETVIRDFAWEKTYKKIKRILLKAAGF